MAVVCAKCSAEIPAGAQFCAACGTPLAAAVPAYAPVAGQPLSGQPVMLQTKSSSSALKIILIVVAIFVVLGALGAGAVGFMVWRVSRHVHVNGASGEVTLNTPGGHIVANSSKNFTANDLGTPIYPGAQSTSDSMRMDLPSGSVVTGVFITSDSKGAVVDFYKSNFGSGASIFDAADTAVLSVKKGDQESVMVTVSAKQSENDGKTKIVIVHSKTAKSS